MSYSEVMWLTVLPRSRWRSQSYHYVFKELGKPENKNNARGYFILFQILFTRWGQKNHFAKWLMDMGCSENHPCTIHNHFIRSQGCGSQSQQAPPWTGHHSITGQERNVKCDLTFRSGGGSFAFCLPFPTRCSGAPEKIREWLIQLFHTVGIQRRLVAAEDPAAIAGSSEFTCTMTWTQMFVFLRLSGLTVRSATTN